MVLTNFFLNNVSNILITLLLSGWIYKELHYKRTLAKFPVAGVPFPGYLGSWIGGVYFIFFGHHVIAQAYKKYAIFQVAMVERMLICLSDVDMIDELCHGDKAKLSFLESIDDDFQAKYTISINVKESLWHIPIIGDKLTKKLFNCLPEMQDEICDAFEAIFDIPSDGYKSVKIFENSLTIFSRLANRFFVGLPLCRDTHYIDVCTGYAADVAIVGYLIRIWPEWLKPFVSRIVNSIPARRQKAMSAIVPIIKQRVEKLETLGSKWAEKPDDFLQWLIDGTIESKGQCKEENMLDIVLRLLFVNFAGVHTSHQTFCCSLYELVKRPEYIGPLREEAIDMVKQYGYTTAAFNRMSKMDSFMRECSRYISLGSIITTRKVMSRYTFLNGVSFPAGSYICAPHHAIHKDEKYYQNASIFNGFRFHDMREAIARQSPSGSNKPQKFALWTSTSKTSLFFGNGQHACPGRFFASMQSKMIFHYLLTTYDMKFAGKPYNLDPNRFQTMYIPAVRGEILFQRLQHQPDRPSNNNTSETHEEAIDEKSSYLPYDNKCSGSLPSFLNTIKLNECTNLNLTEVA